MLTAALLATLTLTQGKPTPPQWAASAGIARFEAKRDRRLILALVTVGGRGLRMQQALNGPDVYRESRGFLLVQVPNDEVARLGRGLPTPPIPQYYFVDPDGRLLKRLSGIARQVDVAHAMQCVRSCAALPAPRTPDDHARQAKRLAMRGDMNSALRLLDGPARAASASERAEAFGAIGDDLRAQMKNKEAHLLLQKAVALSQGPLQGARWRVRLAMNYFRLDDRAMGVKKLLEAQQLKGLPSTEFVELADMIKWLNAPRGR